MPVYLNTVSYSYKQVNKLNYAMLLFSVTSELHIQYVCVCVHVACRERLRNCEAYVCSPVTVAVIVAVWLFSAVV